MQNIDISKLCRFNYLVHQVSCDVLDMPHKLSDYLFASQKSIWYIMTNRLADSSNWPLWNNLRTSRVEILPLILGCVIWIEFTAIQMTYYLLLAYPLSHRIRLSIKPLWVFYAVVNILLSYHSGMADFECYVLYIQFVE